MDKTRVNLKITGLVQGVGFRHFTRQVARSLNLTGWVRNVPDGTVEAVVEGPRADVENALSALRQGPSGSRVDSLDIERLAFRGDFDGFEVRF